MKLTKVPQFWTKGSWQPLLNSSRSDSSPCSSQRQHGMSPCKFSGRPGSQACIAELRQLLLGIVATVPTLLLYACASWTMRLRHLCWQPDLNHSVRGNMSLFRSYLIWFFKSLCASGRWNEQAVMPSENRFWEFLEKRQKSGVFWFVIRFRKIPSKWSQRENRFALI